MPAGAIIVATGFEPFDAHRKPELGYGAYPQVITTLDFERLAAQDFQPGTEPKRVVFIQCVGSRDQALGNPYCSRVCCMVTAKQARLVRQRFPKADVNVFYMDVRAYGKGFEEFYDKAREEGVIYRRGNPSEIIRRGERVVVRAEDTLLGEQVEVEADLVVLAVGMRPRGRLGSYRRAAQVGAHRGWIFARSPSKAAPGGYCRGGCVPGGRLPGAEGCRRVRSSRRALPVRRP